MSLKTSTLVYALLLLVFNFSMLADDSLKPLEKSTNLEPIYIDSNLDHIDFLQERTYSDKVSHIFSHGRSGELLIENQWMSGQILKKWIETNLIFDNTSHINIYGCNFAKGKKGKEAVSYLETALGVSIAASDDITGVDGDWVLEIGNSKDAISIPSYSFNLQCSAGIGGVVGGAMDIDDWDGDGVCNADDKDDDNDGILDDDEGQCLDFIKNGSFEDPAFPGCTTPHIYILPDSEVPHWSSTGNTGDRRECGATVPGGNSNFELWISGFLGIPANEGNQFSEINAHSAGQLTQSLVTPGPGSYVVEYSLAHRGRNGNDVLSINIFDSGTALVSDTVTSGKNNWSEYEGSLPFTTTSSSLDFGFEAISAAGGNTSIGNFIDNIMACIHLDTDGDGIPDYRDTDSDDDGCPDAIEGGGSIEDGNLNGSGMILGNVDATCGVPIQVGNAGQNVGTSIDSLTNICVVPEITATKQLTSQEVLDNGDVKFTFDFTVENTGTSYLDMLSLTDPLVFLPAANPLTQDIVVTVTGGTADMLPTVGGTFDGVGTTELLSGTDGFLAPGQNYMVTLMVEVDVVAFSMIMPQPVENQATASGIPTTPSGTPLTDPDTGMPYMPITDESDDSTEGNEDGGTPEDPTPVVIPGRIDLTKSLSSIANPAASGTIGNVDATYTFNICNFGGADLTGITLIDDFSNEFGSGFVDVTTAPAVGTSTATMDPSVNTSFTGFYPNVNLSTGSDGELAPGECVEITVTVEIDLDQMPDPAENLASATAEDDGTGEMSTDDSDNHAPSGGPNPEDPDDPNIDEEDPTPFPPTPGINVAKSVNEVVPSPTSSDHYYVTYRHIVQNTGNTILEDFILTDDMVTALQGGYIQTTDITVLPGSPAATVPVAAVGTTVMDGTNNALDGMSGLANPGEQFIVDITVEVDVTMITGTQPLLNQSTAEGTPTDGSGNTLTDPSTGMPYMPGDITDESDSGTNPETTNPGSPGDSGGSTDPTPLSLPGQIAVVKTISATAPAASGTAGNYDVTLEFVIENTGSIDLTNINLSDMLAAQWGSAFVAVVTAPAITTAGTDAMTTDPTVNAGFNGNLDSELLNGDGALAPDEFIVVEVVVELDVSESPTTGLENQAMTSGTDPSGNEATDQSDDNTSSTTGADPDTDNSGGSGDDGTGDKNNPSPLLIPEISAAKEVTAAVPAASGVQGNVDVTYQLVVQNTGTTPLEMIELVDDIATQLAPAYVSVTTQPAIVSSSATTDPMTGTLPSALDGTAGVMLPGEQVVVVFTVEIDASEIPMAGLTNQATATGTPTDGMGNPLPDPNNPGGTLGEVTDESDSGSDPDTTNPGEPGDMGGPEDPTPLPPMPSIGVAKAVSNVAAAASGVPGNFDVEYTFVIENTGSATLDNVSLIDDLSSQLGGAFVDVVIAPAIDGASTAATTGGTEAAYDGTAANVELLDLTGDLEPGETIVVTVTVELDPDAPGAILNADSELENQGTASGEPLDENGDPLTNPDGSTAGPVTDESDNGSDGGSDNGDGGTDDRTPVLLPSIGLAKAITNVEEAASGQEGNFDVTIKYTVVNDGNTILSDLSVEDDISTQWGAAYVDITTAPLIIMNESTVGPTENAGYAGAGDLLAPASTDMLEPGQMFMVEVVVEVDPGMAGGMTLMNQATAEATPLDPDGTPLGGSVTDLSDNGVDGTGDNGNGGTVDPTPLDLPSIGVAKAAGTPMPVSGMPGIFDIEYTFIVENTGNTELTDVSLTDDFGSQFGPAFVEITTPPAITGGTATIPGGTNADYSGLGSPFDEMLDGVGVLQPQETLTVTVTVRVDGDAVPDPDNTLMNQADATGTSPDGTEVTDESNNGSDPEGGDETTPTALPCFAEIICPDVADEIVQQNDLGWCAAIVSFPNATVNTDCTGVDDGDVQYMLSMDAIDPATDATVASGAWITGQPSGLMYAEGTTTVTFRVDPTALPAGAVIDPTTCSFDIIIIDKQGPSVICQDINVYLDAAGMISITPADVDGGTVDNCDTPVLAIDVSDFTCDDLGLNNVVMTAEDGEGNIDSCVATVTVLDTILPEISVAAMDMTFDCDGSGNTSDLQTWLDNNASFAATDNCGVPTIGFELLQQNNLCEFTGTSTYAFIATDGSGNTVSDTAVFTIQDITAPVITTDATSIDVVCDGDNNTSELLDWLNNNGDAVATETCGDVTWTNDYGSVAPGACQGTGSITVTFTATDDCGNSSTTQGTITITDEVAPLWTIDPQDVTFECNDSIDPLMQIETWLGVAGFGEAFDSCSVVSYSNDFTALTPTCGTGNAGTAVVTFTATDACGNLTTREATVEVVDMTKPSVSNPATDMTVECDGSGNTAALMAWLDDDAGASWSDMCSEVTMNAPLLLETIEGCGLTTEMRYGFTSTDACGNVSDTTIGIFIIEDTTAPTIDTEGVDMTVECDGMGNDTELDAWLANSAGSVASDICSDEDLEVVWDLVTEEDSCGITGIQVYRFTYTDNCGNSSSTEATFTIEDTTAPDITTDAVSIEVVCDGDNNTSELLDWLNNNGDAVATETCGDITWTNDYGSVAPGACQGTGSITVTFTATDDCGNSSTTQGTITITDEVAPLWTIDPQDVTFECNDSIDPLMQIETWLGAAGFGEAFDSCSVVAYSNDFTALTPTCGTGNAGTAVVTFTATDACGNLTTREATVEVVDMTKPSVSNPATDMTVECDGSGNTAALMAWLDDDAGASWSDMCSEVTMNAPLLLETIEGCGLTTEMRYGFTSTDACGNVSDTTIGIFIIEDTTAPTIDTEGVDMTVECDGMGNDTELEAWLANSAGSVASDICSDEDLEVVWDLVTEEDSCGITGIQVYRFTYTDNCGNSSSTEATFTIEDTTAPDITTDAVSIEVVCDGDNNTSELLDWLNNNGDAVATETCGDVTWTNDYGSVAPGACQGTGSITVTFTATDDCGNSSTTQGTITITDEVAPLWTIDPQDVTFECNDSIDPLMQIETWLGAAGFGEAFDSCSVVSYSNDFTALTPTCGTGNAGTAVVTFTATDACGNLTTREATVEVVDMTKPSVSNPATDMTVECDGSGNTAALMAWLDDDAGASWSDMCSEVTMNAPLLLETIEGCGLTTEMRYGFTSTDACGNVSDTTIGIFIIEDTTAPAIDPEAMNMTVECDGMGNDTELDAWLAGMASSAATDICSDEDLEVEWDLITEEDSCGITGIQVYRFTFTDNCGNSNTTEGTFTIEDTTPAVMAGGADYSGECDQSNANNDDELLSWLNNNAGITADDACGTFTWSNNYHIDNWETGCNDSRNIDVTFYTTDDCGNVDSLIFNFSTGDATPPVFTNCPRPPVVVDAPDGWCSAFVNYSLPLATDNCGVPIVEQTDDSGLSSGDLFPVGLTVLEYTATDSCGNETVCEMKIIVNDFHTPPTITCPEAVETVNDPGECGAVVDGLAPIVEDNCPDNMAVIYEVTDEFGVAIIEGIEDASGETFPGGVTTLTYTVYDQPIVLITEVIQDGTTSGIEIGNLGPATMDISCATIMRIIGMDTVTFVIPNGEILTVGGVYTHDFVDVANAGDEATYILSFIDNVIDEVTINTSDLMGDNIVRIDPVDNDDSSDWRVANDCNPGSYGTFNPELPVFTDNGGTTTFQSKPPSSATCTTTITVDDIEAPVCVTQDTMMFETMNIAITEGSCITSMVTVGAGTVGDVNVQDLLATVDNAGAITAMLTSPSGTEIVLFGNLCEGTEDIDLSLDDSAVSSVTTVSCDPAGNGNTYKPFEEFKAFFGEEAAGDWVLSIYADSPVTGTIDNWTLEVLTNEAYAQTDTLMSNDTLVCSAEFSWVHPVFSDNCCEGSMSVTYDFSNDVTEMTSTDTENLLTPSGFIDLDGTQVTRIFEVGVTVVTYTLTDLAGNISECGFTVTVVDDEAPRFPNGCQDVSITLGPGECTGALTNLPEVVDNCEIDSIAFFIEGEQIDTDFIPIGEHEVVLIATDIYGNVDSCEFNVTVEEFIPDNESLACNNSINLSLGPDCQAIVTADMILEGGPYRCYDSYCITVTDENGVEVDSIFDAGDVGQTFQISITDCTGTGNSCWGYVNVEEKLIPEIECPADVELTCNQSADERYPEGHPMEGMLVTGEATLTTCEPGASITYIDDVIDDGTCSEPRVFVVRNWKVVDLAGNVAECQQTITYLPFDPTVVIFPQDYRLQDAFNCGDVAANPELTEPGNTGWPTLNGESIFGNNYCDINLGYWDEILQDVNCESAYSIFRHWTIENECLPLTFGTNPLTHIQRIKVEDNVAPTLVDIADVTVNVDPWSCRGEYLLPEIVSTDDCSEYEVKWSAPYGHVENGVLTNLLKGETEVTARISDACGNRSTTTFTVTTVDQSAPIAIALQNVVVGLSPSDGDSTSKLYAEALDNGSFDGCSEIKIEIRREEDVCDILGNTTYNNDGHQGDSNLDTDDGAYVKFCCADVTNATVDVNGDGELDEGYVKVLMRVWDDGDADGTFGSAGDNFNEIWSFVKVEDNTPAAIVCPEDAEIYCDWSIEDNFDNREYSNRAGASNSNDFATTQDVDFTTTGAANSYNSCSNGTLDFVDVIITTEGDGIDQCGAGQFTRIFRASTPNKTGGFNRTFCYQKITILSREGDIEISQDINSPSGVGAEDIGPFVITNCEGPTADDLDKYAPIVIGENPCDVVGRSVSIDTFLFEQGVCKKWVVDYKFVNWCDNQEWDDFQSVTFMYVDEEKPVIPNCNNAVQVVAQNDPANCSHALELSNRATDNGGCAGTDGAWLKWQVYVDLWGDGTIDAYGTSYAFTGSWRKTDSSNPFLPSNSNWSDDVWVVNVAPTTSNEITSIPALPSNLILGNMTNHKVTWKVTDGCHNHTSCTEEYMITDQKAPTPYCRSISTAIMDGSDQVEIWAIDFNLGSFDNCTPEGNLRYTFTNVKPQDDPKYDPLTRSSSRTFDCDDLPGGTYRMYVWDEKDNRDYCEVNITLVDNDMSCPEGFIADVGGQITTSRNTELNDVEVTISSIIPEYPKFVNTANGTFEFENNPLNGDYELSASKTDGLLDGVNTLDLVKIQRHLLGLELIEDPYLIIAADINNDEEVKPSDLLSLRKAILGLTDEFPSNTSWRFVDSDQEFTDIQAPFPVDEAREIEGLSTHMMTEDFIAVKVGDVDGSVEDILLQSGAGTSSKTVLSTPDRELKVGESVAIPISSNDMTGVYGYQFTVDVDGLKYSGIDKGSIAMTENHVGDLNGDYVTVSFNDKMPFDINGSEVLFTLNFEVTKAGMLSELIDVNSDITKSEVYMLSQEGKVISKTMKLDVTSDNIDVVVNELHQNDPNPWKESTKVGFVLAESQLATIKVLDMSGRLVHTINVEGHVGYNEVHINSKDVSTSGVYYYRVESGEFVDVKKMIKIE